MMEQLAEFLFLIAPPSLISFTNLFYIWTQRMSEF